MTNFRDLPIDIVPILFSEPGEDIIWLSPLDQFEIRDFISFDATILNNLHFLTTNIGFYLLISTYIILFSIIWAIYTILFKNYIISVLFLKGLSLTYVYIYIVELYNKMLFVLDLLTLAIFFILIISRISRIFKEFWLAIILVNQKLTNKYITIMNKLRNIFDSLFSFLYFVLPLPMPVCGYIFYIAFIVTNVSIKTFNNSVLLILFLLLLYVFFMSVWYKDIRIYRTILVDNTSAVKIGSNIGVGSLILAQALGFLISIILLKDFNNMLILLKDFDIMQFLKDFDNIFSIPTLQCLDLSSENLETFDFLNQHNPFLDNYVETWIPRPETAFHGTNYVEPEWLQEIDNYILPTDILLPDDRQETEHDEGGYVYNMDDNVDAAYKRSKLYEHHGADWLVLVKVDYGDNEAHTLIRDWHRENLLANFIYNVDPFLEDYNNQEVLSYLETKMVGSEPYIKDLTGLSKLEISEKYRETVSYKQELISMGYPEFDEEGVMHPDLKQALNDFIIGDKHRSSLEISLNKLRVEGLALEKEKNEFSILNYEGISRMLDENIAREQINQNPYPTSDWQLPEDVRQQVEIAERKLEINTEKSFHDEDDPQKGNEWGDMFIKTFDPETHYTQINQDNDQVILESEVLQENTDDQVIPESEVLQENTDDQSYIEINDHQVNTEKSFHDEDDPQKGNEWGDMFIKTFDPETHK